VSFVLFVVHTPPAVAITAAREGNYEGHEGHEERAINRTRGASTTDSLFFVFFVLFVVHTPPAVAVTAARMSNHEGHEAHEEGSTSARE